jgi:hypothetical protein
MCLVHRVALAKPRLPYAKVSRPVGAKSRVPLVSADLNICRRSVSFWLAVFQASPRPSQSLKDVPPVSGLTSKHPLERDLLTYSD